MEGVGNEVAASNETRMAATKSDVVKDVYLVTKDTFIVEQKVKRDNDSMPELNGCRDELRSVQLDALPDEILEFILTYLPPYRDLESCRLVCKRWNSVVKSKCKIYLCA